MDGNFGPNTRLDLLSGGGEMGTRIRAHDWAATSLGHPEGWSQALKTLIGVMVSSKQAMFIAWGAERTLLYNDAYAEILARKHPAALGRPILDVWSDIHDKLLPIVEQAYAGESVHMDDITFIMERRGYPEETHFSFSYTPVRDETGSVAGFFCACTEITRQIMAERRLASETERQRRLFEQAPGFIAILRGPGHVFEFANQAYLRLVGNRDCIGRSAREAFPELAGQGFFEWLDQVYARGERVVAEDVPVRLQRAPGTVPEERFLSFVYEPVCDAAGRVTGIFCEGHDVTDAHLAQMALRASEERLRRVLETEAVGVMFFNYEGTLIGANDVFLKITGWSRQEVESGNLDWRRMTPPEWVAASEAQMKDLAGTGRIGPYEKEYLRKDGSRSWMLFAGRDLGDGTIVEFAVDISARKQAEEAARRLAAIIESSDDAILSMDLTGAITSWNKGAERLYGYRAEEVIGQPVTLLIPEDRQDEETGILERTGRGDQIEHFETVRQCKDGHQVAISLTVSPVKDGHGRIIGASKIARDITERKRLEEQLLLVNRELHHRVKNTLATVQAVIASTARRAQTIAEFQQAVTERITSLARTHTLLIEQGHGGASLKGILDFELAPYDDGSGQRVRLAGPDVRLPSEIAVALGMAVHELTTNAAKYGAFSLPSGCVEVTWSVEERADGRKLNLAWQERGGPPVEKPERQGFGSVLLHRALGRQLGGEVETTFAPDGLQVRISAMLPPR
ncbi:hypothetical protein AA309_08940 [Microvirga vignae]|uniref:Blue-light-activated histidine kinase n=1 Tax=Microvirga vignae TaxID=1225564 RepID=A0A0H1RF83_9HYPH|nr:PAS domain S-box protein [Microvirga vignae]KLK93526.1 hypothetical protein AA309_08940 [Microvirga vignae]